MLEHLLNDLFLWNCGLIHAVQPIVKSLTRPFQGGYVAGKVR
jgi:hypothetical protein